jgi:adenine-specific DNA-methyltransferase
LAEQFVANNFSPVPDTKGQESSFYLSRTGALCVRKKRLDNQSHVLTVLKGMGTVQSASSSLEELGISFSYPKPTALLEYLIKVGSLDSDIVADLFAGSGTLAEAVFRLNSQGGRRTFIVVQWPETIGNGTRIEGATISTIADLAKERIRRAGAKIKTENALTAPNLDTGFRVLKIDTSNMNDVYYAPDAVAQEKLLGQVDNIRPDRLPEDLVFQLLIDWGLDLSLPITDETIAGKKVFFVDGNTLAACFDTEISEELVTELARRKPLRAVFRDASFTSDSVKINVDQIFKLLSPETEVRSV